MENLARRKARTRSRAWTGAWRIGAMLVAGWATPGLQAQPSGFDPKRPIEVIVPYAAGGGVSNMARAFAAEAAREMGQPWVVVNREGAGGVVGFAALARAAADGHTLAFSPASPLTNAPFINTRMPFRSEQVKPVCKVFDNVFVLAVKPDSPIASLQDLMARARAAPGTLAYGHAGPASVGHLAVAAIERAGEVKFNAIAYRGDAQALVDVQAGTLDFAALGAGTLSGKNMRTMAVLSARRHPALPEVPAITEFGLPAISPGLNGLFVPAGTPAPLVQRLEAVCHKVTTSQAFNQRASAMAQVTGWLGAQDFRQLIDTTYRTHESLVPGLKLEKN